MGRARLPRNLYAFLIAVYLLSLPAQAQYSGGSGTADDPYRIATAADLMTLGETPNDYDKHFILTADIDLDPNLPGGRAFAAALIAADTDPTLDFEGDFDGNDRKIGNLTIHAEDGTHLGFFGCIGPGGRVRDLELEDVHIVGWSRVGGLAACNEGRIATCRVSGSIEGYEFLGGLVGINFGAIADSRATIDVSCDGEYPGDAGGLVGWHQKGTIVNCSATGAVVAGDGGGMLGGLVGHNGYIGCFGPFWTGEIINCYATGPVVAGIGADALSGLVGHDELGSLVHCYASGKVAGGENSAYLGGLVGWSMRLSHATACFWDVETSGQATSAGGTGLTTAEMQTAATFLVAGWDFIDETENGPNDVWWILEGQDYPRLWWELPTGYVVLVVDDFERYSNKHGSRPFETWIDTFGFLVPEPGHPGNGTGAIVGHFWCDPPHPGLPTGPMETAIVHGGQQSMPLYYDNTLKPYYSEAERTFTTPSNWTPDAVETPQNWTAGGADALTLHIHGRADNDPEPLYVVVADSTGNVAVVRHPNAEAVLATEWHKWHIALADLQAAGVDVASVAKMTIGLGNRGNPEPGCEGMIYLDDILVTNRVP